MPLALICSYTSWTMLKKRTYLPDIWSDPFIAAVPVEQAGEVTKYLEEYGDCQCIDIKDSPLPGQDWIEALILSLGNAFENDEYVAGEVEKLFETNTTSLSASGRRMKVLKDILRHICRGKRLLLFLNQPVSQMRETGFGYLTRFIGSSIGIICIVSSINDVPPINQIHYFPIRKSINEGHPVYISYSRDDSTSLAEMICTTLESNNVECMFDMRDVPAQSSIHEFEQAIGKGDLVIVVLSDNYFESPHCMFEMAGVTRQGDISKRVVFVSNLQNVKRNKTSHDLILKKWKQRHKEYDNIDAVDVAMQQEKDDIQAIIDYFPEFWLHAKDDVSFLATNVEADTAAELSDYIVHLITQKEKEKTIQMQPLHDPINSGNTPSISVRQFGEHSVYIGSINGDVHFGA